MRLAIFSCAAIFPCSLVCLRWLFMQNVRIGAMRVWRQILSPQLANLAGYPSATDSAFRDIKYH